MRYSTERFGIDPTQCLNARGGALLPVSNVKADKTMRQLIRAAAFAVCFVASTLATAIEVLDSARIRVDASGSLNNIGGYGHIDHLLDIEDVSTIQSFEIEYLGTDTTPTLPGPEGVGLSFWSFTPWYYATGVSFRPPYIGQVAVPYPEDYVLRGLVRDSGWPLPTIYMNLVWPFGGISAVATSNFEIRALGEPGPTTIPEPATLALLGLGLGGLGYSRRKQ